MSVKYFDDIKEQALIAVAESMLIAAKTAPKGKGMEMLSYAIIDGEDIENISQKMIEMGHANNAPGFIRDGNNIKTSPVIVLIGTKIKSLGLNERCQLCSFKNCAERENHPNIPCIFNTVNLGIAVDSAVSVAMNHKVDNRIMYSIGQAAKELNLMEEDVKIIFGIPLSASEKNIFFDR